MVRVVKVAASSSYRRAVDGCEGGRVGASEKLCLALLELRGAVLPGDEGVEEGCVPQAQARRRYHLPEPLTAHSAPRCSDTLTRHTLGSAGSAAATATMGVLLA